MSFPKSFLEELKNRIRVSDVVGRKVKLTRRGREFVGLSPFNNEKTPSFTVNDDKQFYHCFSTGEHGDAIKFLEKTENLSFLEAVERLAGEAGMEMPRRDPQEAEREQKRTGLIDVMSAAQDYFRESLARGKGAEARAYLSRRGLSDVTIENFGIGFAPDDRSGLKSYMMGRGFKIPQMVEGGLLISGEDIREPYDRFRNRVMFPIKDARGRVIAFGGRALDPNAKAKYMNSPETPLFHKGRLLYNLARARKPSYDEGSVVVVEGYMDVVALGQAGIANAVAPLGTALTEDQIGLLWRLAPEPVLCFDGDKAGLRAAYRAVERVLPLLKPGHSLRFALLPEGQDPDDLVKSGGVEAMEEVLAAARPLSEIVWDKEVEAGTWDTPERKAQLKSKISEVIREISDPTVQGFYRDALNERLDKFLRPHQGASGRTGWRNERQNDGYQSKKPWNPQGNAKGSPAFRQPSTPQLKQSSLARGGDQGASRREQLLILTLLNHPGLLEAYCEDLSAVEIKDRMLDKIRNEIIDIAAVHAPLDREALRGHLDKRGLSDIAHRLESGTALRSEIFAWADANEQEAEEAWLHLLQWHQRAADLQMELKAAERALAEEMTDENLTRLKALHAELGGLSKF